MYLLKRVVGRLSQFLRSRVGSLVGMASLITVAGLGLAFSMGPASAAHRSSCENGENTGRICHYVYIVSEGPGYEADMEMQTLDGFPYQGVSKWHEDKPDYTRWYWDYDQRLEKVDFKLHLKIFVKGTNFGLDTTLAGDRDTCFQISRTSNKVLEVQCPVGGGIG